MPQSTSNKYPVFGALIVVQILFGINYVVSKEIVGVFPPIVWANFRVVVSAAFLIGIALLSGRKHPVPKKSFFVPLIFYSLLGVIINQGCFLIGLHYTTPT